MLGVTDQESTSSTLEFCKYCPRGMSNKSLGPRLRTSSTGVSTVAVAAGTAADAFSVLTPRLKPFLAPPVARADVALGKPTKPRPLVVASAEELLPWFRQRPVAFAVCDAEGLLRICRGEVANALVAMNAEGLLRICDGVVAVPFARSSMMILISNRDAELSGCSAVTWMSHVVPAKMGSVKPWKYRALTGSRCIHAPASSVASTELSSGELTQ